MFTYFVNFLGRSKHYSKKVVLEDIVLPSLECECRKINLEGIVLASRIKRLYETFPDDVVRPVSLDGFVEENWEALAKKGVI